jgi:uncharacterized protein YndB with AHSA1/START domain
MTTLISTDRLEKQIRLDSPRSRVWRALTDAREFGTWFGVALDGTFAPGANVCGRITIPGHTHCIFDAVVEAMEPERFFSFRWHPYAVDPDVDYSQEPRTLVEFTLEPDGEGTLLTVVESGFDAIPASRRAKAFEMNSAGWAGQLKNIRKHVEAQG